jgi:hypothetical protein
MKTEAVINTGSTRERGNWNERKNEHDHKRIKIILLAGNEKLDNKSGK